MVSIAARLAVYEPDGVLKGYLQEPQSWSASFPWNDTSALKLDYTAAATDSNLLTDPVEVGIEIWDGTTWTEPPNARYRRLEVSSDHAQKTADTRSYTMPGYAGILEGIAVIPQKYGEATQYDSEGKRKFLSATVGEILTTVLNEARNLVEGLAPGLDLAFTKLKDSAGKTWTRTITIYYEPGLSMLTVLDNLAQQGQCDWWFENRTLHVVNPDTTTTKHAIYLPQTTQESPVRSSLAGLLHTGFLVGESETWRVDNEGTPTPWGTSIRVLTQGGVRDEATAKQLIKSELEEGSRERIEYTWSASTALAAESPFADYQCGDYVYSYNRDGEYEEMRVAQIALSFGESGLTVDLTLNDRFTDSFLRLAKRTKGIVNGASGDAGTGTSPSQLASARPRKPEGLILGSEGYWEDTGQALSTVSASWGAVTHDIRGSSSEISQYRVTCAGQTVYTDQTTIGFSGLTPGKIVTVTVVAIDNDELTSEAASLSIRTELPLEQLDPPTKFNAEADYGVVTVLWDGLLDPGFTGQPYIPPLHLAQINVEESPSASGPWTPVGALTGRVLVLDRQSIIGQTRWYRGVAIDRLGNQSAPSTPASITIESIITSELQDSQAKLDEAQQAITGQLTTLDQTVTSVSTMANGLTQSYRSPNEPTADTPGKNEGDRWTQYGVTAGSAERHVIGEWDWDGQEWVPALTTDSVITNLSVFKLTADNAQIDSWTGKEAVIDQLWAAGIAAKTGTFERLTVASGNLLPDIGVYAMNPSIRTGDENDPYREFTLNVDDSSLCYTAQDTGNTTMIYQPVEVQKGRRYYLSFDAYTDDPETMITIQTGTVDSEGKFTPAYVEIDGIRLSTTPISAGFTSGSGDDTLKSFAVAFGALNTGTLYFRFKTRENPLPATIHIRNLRLIPQASAVHIQDGAINANKALFDQAWADQFWANTANFGKVSTQMFSTTAAFSGDGVHIDRTGIKIEANNGHLTASAAEGLRFKGPSGDTVFWLDSAGSASFSGNILGSRISGSSLEVSNDGQKIFVGLGGAANTPGIWIRDENGRDRVSLNFSNSGREPSLWFYDSFGERRLRVTSTGEMTFTSPNGYEAFKIGAYNDKGYGRAWLYGPTYGAERPHILLGRISDSGGTVKPGVTVKGADGNADTSWMTVLGNGDWFIGSTGNRYVLGSVYALDIMTKKNLRIYDLPETTGSNIPLVMKNSSTGSPLIYMQTSVRASKTAILDVGVDPYKVLDVRVRDWFDRGDWESYQAALDGERDTVRGWDPAIMPRRVPGIVAEELEGAGLAEFCAYDDVGNLVGVQYDRVALLLIPIVKDLKTRLDILERKNG